MSKKFILGVAGPSGSGKTTITKKIKNELIANGYSDRLLTLSEDDFYLPGLEKSRNFDHPDSIDHELMITGIDKFKENAEFSIPTYNFVSRDRIDNCSRLMTEDVMILEGILWVTNEQIRSQVDLIIFVDTPLELCFLRRIARDISERGRELPYVIKQLEEQVRPMYYKFIEPCKKFADIYLAGEKEGTAIVSLISASIISKINR